MCLAVPARVIAVHDSPRGQVGRTATIEVGGNRIDVSLALLPKTGVGAWVLVHAGMALEEVDEAEARETWGWLKEMGMADEEQP